MSADRPKCAKLLFGRFQPPHAGHFDMIEQAAAPGCATFVFVSPRTSRDDATRGAFADEDRYPFTAATRVGMMTAGLKARLGEDMGGIRIITDEPTAQRAALRVQQDTGLAPEDIELVYGEDRDEAFTRNFRDPGATALERGLGLRAVPRPPAAFSGTETRRRLAERMLLSGVGRTDILPAIRGDEYLDAALPEDEAARMLAVRDYADNIAYLGARRPYGAYSPLALGRSRGQGKRKTRGKRKPEGKRKTRGKRKPEGKPRGKRKPRGKTKRGQRKKMLR